MIGRETSKLLDEMTLVELVDLRNDYQYSRRPNAPMLLRLLGTEIRIRQRLIKERNMTVVLA